MSAGLGTLNEQLLTAIGEVATTRQHAEAGFAGIERRLAAQDEALSAAQEATQGALTNVRSRQDALMKVLVDVQRLQADLSRRHDALLPLLTELQRQDIDLAQRLAAVSQALASVRGVADTTQSTATAIFEVSGRLQPTMVSALEEVRRSLATDITRARRRQRTSLVVILAAIVLAWAAFEGIIPGV